MRAGAFAFILVLAFCAAALGAGASARHIDGRASDVRLRIDPGANASARAAGEPTVEVVSVRGRRSLAPEPGRETKEYDVGEAMPEYAGDVRAEFRVRAAEFALYAVRSGGERVMLTDGRKKVVGETVEFVASESGRYAIECVAFDPGSDAELGRARTGELKADCDAPRIGDGFFWNMTEWAKPGAESAVGLDWTKASDELSGLARMGFKRVGIDNDGYVMRFPLSETVGPETFKIENATVVVATIEDMAGNVVERKFEFGLFDGIAPPKPKCRVEPEPAPTRRAPEYRIFVEFAPDEGGSGLKERQRYRRTTISRVSSGGGTVDAKETKEFEFLGRAESPGVITASEPKGHEFEFRAVDNAGNESEPTIVRLPFEAFDCEAPRHSRFAVEFDMGNASGICRVSVEARDAASGVKSARIAGGPELRNAGTDPRYEARGDFFDLDGVVELTLTDFAGNATKEILPFPHYGNARLKAKLRECAEKLRASEMSEYCAEAQAGIEEDLRALNATLNGAAAREKDISDRCDALAKRLEGAPKLKFRIDGNAKNAPAGVTLEPLGSGYAEFGKGATVTVALSECAPPDPAELSAATGFENAEYSAFALEICANGEAMNAPLRDGVRVGFARPRGADGAVKILKGGEALTIEEIDNRIYFVARESGEYALAVERPECPAGKAKKTVAIFGREASVGAVAGIASGVGAAATIGIAVGIGAAIKKKRKKKPEKGEKERSV